MKILKASFFAVAAFALVRHSSALAADIQITQGDATAPSVIDITGPIESGDADRFYDFSQRTERAIVFLHSPGGLVDEGLSIAAEIGQRGFTTIVAPGAECHSICAVIWVSGGSRMMDSTSTIGVHAAYRNQALEDGTSLISESGVANADIGSFLTHVGLSREAIRYFTTAGPNDVLPITPAIAQRLDIDTAVTDGSLIRMPDERPTPRRLAWQAVTYIGLSVDCAPLFGLDAAFLREQGGQRLKLGHELFGGELFASLVPEMSSQVNSTKVSIALKDWCTGAATDLHQQGLSVGISGPGYNCARAATSTEHAICGSFELWLEDRALGSIYSVLRNRSSDGERSALAEKQRIWISQRDRCGDDAACILDRYRAWFLDLSLIAATAN
ncbi:hypothetical protein H4P12_11600 [Paracoccus sp. 11-3]|uniref:Lysozyme inhibitor LprI-like N-terminal domain-containing protein n=1 Tax=Paracoccus amoyensis TaxID=2760093 RepID=A0A926GAA6_9RHOB|nr:lysozyme inhibitor LprI family protein [Paracoccus amoyensis]MBC9247338.1 hypothetical protein [Paracoccus amoyensis]